MERKAAQNTAIDYCVASGSLGGNRNVMSADYWFSVQKGPIAYLLCLLESQQFIGGKAKRYDFQEISHDVQFLGGKVPPLQLL